MGYRVADADYNPVKPRCEGYFNLSNANLDSNEGCGEKKLDALGNENAMRGTSWGFNLG